MNLVTSHRFPTSKLFYSFLTIIKTKKKNENFGDFVFFMFFGIYFLKSLDYPCSLEWELFLLFGLSRLWGVVARLVVFPFFAKVIMGWKVYFHLIIGIVPCGPFAYGRYDNNKEKNA